MCCVSEIYRSNINYAWKMRKMSKLLYTVMLSNISVDNKRTNMHQEYIRQYIIYNECIILHRMLIYSNSTNTANLCNYVVRWMLCAPWLSNIPHKTKKKWKTFPCLIIKFYSNYNVMLTERKTGVDERRRYQELRMWQLLLQVTITVYYYYYFIGKICNRRL